MVKSWGFGIEQTWVSPACGVTLGKSLYQSSGRTGPPTGLCCIRTILETIHVQRKEIILHLINLIRDNHVGEICAAGR